MNANQILRNTARSNLRNLRIAGMPGSRISWFNILIAFMRVRLRLDSTCCVLQAAAYGEPHRAWPPARLELVHRLRGRWDLDMHIV